MSRQHSKPYFVSNGTAYPLETAEGSFSEKWLQDFLFEHADVLPVSEIEPVFGPLISVCRELNTKVGPLDLLFANTEGLLTLVECKLWKNPEARREVVAQILDYAKEISSWSYEQLEAAIRTSSKQRLASLFRLAEGLSEDLNERDFVDSVIRNLKRGRFLLLIVGNGIRESVEALAEFLQRHAHMNFTLALVELAVYKTPEGRGDKLVLPRVIAQTVEIERLVIRLKDDRIIAEAPTAQVVKVGTSPSGTRTKISEQVFYENLAEVDPTASVQLRTFLDRAKRLGWSVDSGQNSLMLKYKSGDAELNFGIFRTEGTFQNRGIGRVPQIGETYLTQLASLLPDAHVQEAKDNFLREVRGSDGRNLKIADLLAVQDKWLQLIQETINAYLKAQERD